MRVRNFWILAAVLVATTMAVAAPPGDGCDRRLTTTRTETFDDGWNRSGWSFGAANDAVLPRGGRPGDWLHNGTLATFAPRPSASADVPSPFVGDYAGRGVIRMEVDARIALVSFTTAERPMSVLFRNDNGTPKEPFDDLFVFYVGPDNIPEAGSPKQGGWTHYAFDVPASSATLPNPRSTVEGEPGWVAAEGDVFTPARDPDAVWALVMRDVDEVTFWFHDPRYFALIQDWDVGIDNPSITTCSE
jgi:hypothetical protein